MFNITFVFGLFNAVIGLACYLLPSVFGLAGGFVVTFGIITLIFYLVNFRWSLLFQVRILLLASIGYFAGVVKAVDPLLLFSPVEAESQSFEIGVKMFGLTSIALFGSFIGISIGFRRGVCRRNLLSSRLSVGFNDWYLIYYFSLVIVLITGYFSALSYGPTVFQGVYGTGEGRGQALGNLQSIGIVCAVLSIVASMLIGKKKYMYFSIAAILYFFVWGILIRGGRLEVLSGLLTIIICIPLLNGKITRITMRQLVYVVFLAVFMESWGWIRSTLTTFDSESIFEGYKRLAESGIYFAGTVSGIATSFANTLHMVDQNIISHLWGRSYFEYIPRTPPEFLYPDRPSDYSSIFDNYGYAAVGGFFELAEAYLNFGVFGCFIVPLLISFSLSKIYQNSFNGGLFWFLMLSAVLSVFFRGAWYQSFAFYKSLFTGLVIYALVVLVVSLFGMHMSRRKSTDLLALRSSK